MWSKISGAFKSGKAHDEPEPTHPHPDVMGRVLDQHPNLSVFHQQPEQPPRPDSPSKHGLRGVFKRPPKQQDLDQESIRSPSPFKLPGAFTSKVSSHLHFQNGNASQASVGRNTERPHLDGLGRPEKVKDTKKNSSMRRASIDLLRRSPSLDLLRTRPSLDALNSHEPDHPDGRPQNQRSPTAPPSAMRPQPLAMGDETKYGSVRSIMREPNTPGTGQNVRFFSRNAYMTISPNTSVDESNLGPVVEDANFMERLQRASGTQTLPAILSPKGKSRPSLGNLFSPPHDEDGPVATSSPREGEDAANNSNPFDISQEIQLPPMPPPGLSLALDIQNQLPEMSADLSGHGLTSTPAAKGKGKQKEEVSPVVDLTESTKGLPQLPVIPEPGPPAESIFHAQEKPPRLPSLLGHDRSQSFSFGQTLYHSMGQGNSKRDSKMSDKSSSTKRSSVASSSEVAYTSSELKPSSISPSSRLTDSPASSVSAKSRSRAFSDTRFYSMMRSSPGGGKPPPELDINDESSTDIVVEPEQAPQPDPFNAHANTYYGPQTMIPTTPPKSSISSSMHSRKMSKDDALICSLQTQLALQTELVGQYETDLRARDETVHILERRIAESEKEENKRRATLRAMRKKVLELEKHVRYLQEEVDSSQQVSMERSIMDEASGQALRTLHRQIAELEREKEAMGRREDNLHDEVASLQRALRERSDEAEELRETLRTRDESTRALQDGIQAAHAQIEQMGNVSVCVDEDELRRLATPHEARDHAAEQQRAAEFQWREGRAELLTRAEGLAVEVEQLREEKDRLREEYDAKCAQLHTRDEEYNTLRAELEAQWQHTEKMTEEAEEMRRKVEHAEEERDGLKAVVEDLERRMNGMEVEWTQSENKRNEYEAEAQQLWDEKEALAKDKEEVSMFLPGIFSCADRACSLSNTYPRNAITSRSSSTRSLSSRTASTSWSARPSSRTRASLASRSSSASVMLRSRSSANSSRSRSAPRRTRKSR
ncbi:uncharacterized protein SCHCODRAFT_02070213 [Schizophyllum commune H4-8]|uniref:uncharacterized protein n=1 Tax=Schizophyllum commune (strain H4-8 / FGSC 9210) TaxID=578458 RepID=UPI00215E4434|nr:uncharacterized protein SCHCODRAFT_02070213 [Schizophyllum commune H4-8]KAI5887680.1 hypothetical protein SCHCODRAFT_02070213 [Schizophyllum commune H4-8]